MVESLESFVMALISEFLSANNSEADQSGRVV
jgi:hypothetical protein